jgi:hypothetical protein
VAPPAALHSLSQISKGVLDETFGIVACGLLLLSGSGTASAQTTVTRQITTEPVETVITRGPNGTVVTRRPLNPAPRAVDPYAPPYPPSVEYVPYNTPVVAADTEPDQTITVRRERQVSSTRTSRVVPRTVPRRERLVLSPAQREIVYRTIVRREVYPQPDVRSAYPPVVARTDVIEPSPRSYPLRSIRPFPNDNAYETYTAPR